MSVFSSDIFFSVDTFMILHFTLKSFLHISYENMNINFSFSIMW